MHSTSVCMFIVNCMLISACADRPSAIDWVYDPQGPPDGDAKISKGLSWYYDGHDTLGNPLPLGIHLPEVRYQSPRDTRNDGFGFRIARDAN